MSSITTLCTKSHLFWDLPKSATNNILDFLSPADFKAAQLISRFFGLLTDRVVSERLIWKPVVEGNFAESQILSVKRNNLTWEESYWMLRLKHHRTISRPLTDQALQAAKCVLGPRTWQPALEGNFTESQILSVKGNNLTWEEMYLMLRLKHYGTPFCRRMFIEDFQAANRVLGPEGV